MKPVYWNKYQHINKYLFDNLNIASKNDEYIDKRNSTYTNQIRFWNKSNPKDKTELNFETENENNCFIEKLFGQLNTITCVNDITSVFNIVLGELYLD